MKLSIEGTPAEIKNALLAICGSEERDELLANLDRLTNLLTTNI